MNITGKIENVSFHFFVNGYAKSTILEKIILRYEEKTESYITKLNVVVEGVEYAINENSYMEGSIICLQKQFPKSIKIACCQTCRHGNFCPFGDNDNEIFCLKNFTPKDKSDVVDIFIKYSSGEISLLRHQLLQVKSIGFRCLI